MGAQNRIIIAAGICIGIVLGGTLGYMLLEDYTFFQGLYMSAITMSTVGYGEVKPLSPMGQGFSMALIFCSIIGLALAGRALGESLIENAWSGRTEKRKMQRKIQSLRGHHIICGFGRVGRAAAAQFTAAGASFVVLDQAHVLDPEASETSHPFIEGDATREQTLVDAGIKHARGLLAILGSDPDNVFLVLTARELNPTLRIIARANDPSVENKLLKAGADTVISPFTTAGIQVANDMLLSTGHNDKACGTSPDVAHPPRWLSLKAGDPRVGSDVAQAVHQLGGPILGLRRGKRDHLMPVADYTLKADDALLVIAAAPSAANDPQNAAQESKQVVIIDDNPVIVKLYTRLFQKAGFIPHTAADGSEGLDLIKRVRPAAAVIDFMLPVLSGIEICTRVRKNADLDGIRLILFTADNNVATRQRAISAGADAVVVKSPEAQEVIETVIRIISEKKLIRTSVPPAKGACKP